MPGFTILLSLLFALIWLFVGALTILGAGRDSAIFLRDRAANRQWSLTSIGVASGLMFALLFLWMFADMILPTSNRIVDSSDRKTHYNADLKTVTTRMEGWFKTNGYDLPAYQGYVFKTVPQEKQVGTAMVYRAYKPDVTQRWEWTWHGWQPRAPFLYIECLGCDKPVETVVHISVGIATRGSWAAGHFRAELDRLETALNNNQNIEKNASASPPGLSPL